jgi:hypothetical protein
MIGPGSIGATNIAGSLAGAQRTGSESDRIKESGAAKKFAGDQRAMSASKLEDVGETNLSADRDPDGRKLYSDPTEENVEEGLADPPMRKSSKSLDAFGECGQSLDLEM